MENKHAQILGRRGGKAGKGKSKVRGNANYYRDIALIRWRKKCSFALGIPGLYCLTHIRPHN